MKRILILSVFTASMVFAQGINITVEHLSELQYYLQQYKTLLLDGGSTSTVKQKIFDLKFNPSLTLAGGRISLPIQLDIYEPFFTNYVNNSDKLFVIDTDQIKISNLLFLITTIDEDYKNHKNINHFYRQVFKDSEIYLRELAMKALRTTDVHERENLNIQFNLLVRSLSSIPFPPAYSYYKRRIAYSISTPEAAQQQIDRINQNLLNIK